MALTRFIIRRIRIRVSWKAFFFFQHHWTKAALLSLLYSRFWWAWNTTVWYWKGEKRETLMAPQSKGTTKACKECKWPVIILQWADMHLLATDSICGATALQLTPGGWYILSIPTTDSSHGDAFLPGHLSHLLWRVVDFHTMRPCCSAHLQNLYIFSSSDILSLTLRTHVAH